jgi:hypothetical protein
MVLPVVEAMEPVWVSICVLGCPSRVARWTVWISGTGLDLWRGSYEQTKLTEQGR